jgi:hypothetical protein
VREWRLASGQTLTLRPGDELTVDAGSRLRFEAGRRVPGAPASGVTWADAPARGPGMLPAALGALVTLVGGAVALVPAGTRRGAPAALGPLLLLAGVAAAMGWGIYAAATAPDLALGGSLLAPLLGLPSLALGARAGLPLAAAAAAGIALLLLGGTIALRQRLAAAARPQPALWAGVVALAGVLTTGGFDPWRLIVLGLGLGASAWAPAVLASSRAGSVAGAVVGAGVFVALAGLPALTPVTTWGLQTLVRYPALVALPLAWAAAHAADAVVGGDEID